MADVIDLFDDDWWLERAFAAMRRRRDRRVKLLVIALAAKWDVIDGGKAEVEEEDDLNTA